MIDVNSKVNSKSTIYNVSHKVETYLQETIGDSLSGRNVIQTIKTIKTKIKNDNLIVSKADKCNSLVILKECEYNQKVKDFLDNNEIEECKKNPVPTQNNHFRKLVDSCKELTEHPKLLIEMNPRIPVLKGYVKIHKASESMDIRDVPIRPVVSTKGSVTYKLEKFLISLFKKHTQWKAEYSIKNSTELTEKLKKVRLPNNAKLISLDVENLFNNVDGGTAVLQTKNILETHSKFSRKEISEFCKLLQYTTTNNYFEYNQTTFKLKEGLPMGAPISPLMAEVFMDDIDHKIVTLEKWRNRIFKYFRLVDDSFGIWLGSEREAEQFVKELNNLHPKIKFKLEFGGKKLNYLDLTIQIKNNKLKFSIYRKPCYTDAIIPENSYHSWQQKMAGFHSFLNRLINIPLSKQDYNKELNTILEIAINNGYKKEDILKILMKKKSKRIDQRLYNKVPDRNKKWISIPYVEKLSQSITQLVKSEYNVTFNNDKNLGGFLINTGKINENQDSLEQSGIYRITCECGSLYIGQTGRSIKTRTKEHLNHAKNKKYGHSSLSDHLIDSKHPLEKCEVKVMRKCKKGKKMNVCEQLEIDRFKTKAILNSQTESTITTVITPPTLMDYYVITGSEEECQGYQSRHERERGRGHRQLAIAKTYREKF
ncbi:uncharacterized protein [Bemisia tabaci]|uniref:uncharacterized protein n=2 Tax=Bemisia tabaci TaxID=7038 RepID=UPI003B27D6BA